MSPSRRQQQSNSPDTVRAILAARGLSLAEISRQSRLQFAGNHLFRIPPNFYDGIRRASFSPSLHQLFAFSVLTGYRLADWLHVFGFSFDDVARSQAFWPRHDTAELDARIYDSTASVSWFLEANPVRFGAELTPVSQWLTGRTIRPLDSLASRLGPFFRYLKVGSRDAYAFPDLLPGSIVRIDGRISAELLLAEENSERILAIEHSRGIVCSRLRPAGRGHFVLSSRQLPYAPVELRLGTEARILGVVDLEIRRLASLEVPIVSTSAGRLWTPGVLRQRMASGPIGEYIRRARMRSGLSFREASERTREIAESLGHPNYFCAVSALSDMEARDLFPRHIHKLISLSAIYCLPVADLAGLAGLRIEDAGQEAMPEEWKQTLGGQAGTRSLPSSHFLEAVQDAIEEVPYFLREALPAIVGLPSLSVRDLYWVGATSNLIHPYLRDSLFIALNRKSKTPVMSLTSPVWAQPLYVLEMRNGGRLCGSCSLQNGTLLFRPCTGTPGNLLRLRNRVDAEVLGKIVLIVRRVNGRK
jgi:hypothetical protein